MVLVFPLYALLGSSYHGERGVYGALVAGVVCWVAGVLALIVTGIARWMGDAFALPGLLMSMMFRMGIPLLIGTVFSRQSAFDGTGVFGMIVGYYLFALAVETPLSLVAGSADGLHVTKQKWTEAS